MVLSEFVACLFIQQASVDTSDVPERRQTLFFWLQHIFPFISTSIPIFDTCEFNLHRETSRSKCYAFRCFQGGNFGWRLGRFGSR